MSVDASMVLDFYELEAELKALGAAATAAEAHGILCGQLSGGRMEDAAGWLDPFLQTIGQRGQLRDSSREWFTSLHKLTLQEMSHSDMDFMPLLPDDEDRLGERLSALAEWCSGFLAGFGSSGVRSANEFNEETLSALKDIQQISQVDPEAEESQEDEAAYFEVLEYVRMAALLVFTEFAMTRNTGVPDGVTIH